MIPATERDMSFGTRNVRSLYRPGSLMTVARELAKYKLDLVGVGEVMWDKEGTVRAGSIFFLWQRTGKSSIGNLILFTPENSISNQESGVC
jgi:hypothetical protein